jgi:hypothetical protein
MKAKSIFFSVVLGVVALSSFASPASAQDATDEAMRLREEFRSALVSDPRSAQLSEAELNSMVEALASKAEEQDTIYDFILPPLPQFVEEFSEGVVTPWGQPVSPEMLYGVILLCLAFAGLLLWWMLHLHRKHAHLV